MADWTKLPNDVIAHIASRVKVIEDFIAFGAVCTSWRIGATKDNFDVLSPQVPLFMVKDGFYSLSKKKVLPIFLPEVTRSEYVSIKEGWLCTVSYDTGEMTLFHPFSRKKIQLPSQNALLTFGGDCWSCVERAILSANPSVTSDYVLMVYHYGPYPCLACWRPGDLHWTLVDVDVVSFTDVVAALVYHKGEFYSMSHCGKVKAYQIAGPNTNTTDQPIVKTRVVGEIDRYTFGRRIAKYYLVELSGALLLVIQLAKRNVDDPSRTYETFKFNVYELDITRGELKEEMNTLGNSSMFLGHNWATCIDSSQFTGVKPNHIYFAQKWSKYSDSLDMGAYNLEDGKIESFYDERWSYCPPAWVMPSIN